MKKPQPLNETRRDNESSLDSTSPLNTHTELSEHQSNRDSTIAGRDTRAIEIAPLLEEIPEQ